MGQIVTSRPRPRLALKVQDALDGARNLGADRTGLHTPSAGFGKPPVQVPAGRGA